MSRRRLLFLDAHRLTAYRWQSGTLQAEGEFFPDSPGLAAFDQYLSKSPRSLFFMLAEVAEEGFQISEIPAVSGKDRTALLKRKLGQYFFGTPFATAISLGREKTGRHDEKVLFSALTHPQHFDPWLAVLRQNEVPLAGIHSLPLIGTRIAAEQSAPGTGFLLVTLTRGGLRQTFYQGGQCRFSRLTALTGEGIDDAAIACNVEAGKTFHYLHSQRLLHQDVSFRVLVLAHPGQFSKFRTHCHDSAELRFEYLDLLALSGRHGLRTLPEDSRSDLLFLHLLARTPPAWQFAPEEDRHFYRLWQGRTALTRTGIAALVAALIFAAGAGMEARQTGARTSEILAEAAADRGRYAAMLRTLPQIPLTTENLRALTDRYEALVLRSPGIEPALIHLSQALDHFPNVDITRIDWAITDRPEDGPLPSTGVSQALQAATPAGATGPAAVADVHGELPVGLINDHRAQLTAINGLADRLRSHPGTTVRILTLPFDIESGKSIRSDDDNASAIAPPRFSLRVTTRLQ